MCRGKERCDEDDPFFQAALRRTRSHARARSTNVWTLDYEIKGIRGEQPVAMLTGQFQCESTLVDKGSRGDTGWDQRIYYKGKLYWVNAVCNGYHDPDLLVSKKRLRLGSLYVLSKYHGPCEPGELLGWMFGKQVAEWPIDYNMHEPAHKVPRGVLHDIQKLRSMIWNGEITVKSPLDP